MTAVPLTGQATRRVDSVYAKITRSLITYFLACHVVSVGPHLGGLIRDASQGTTYGLGVHAAGLFGGGVLFKGGIQKSLKQ